MKYDVALSFAGEDRKYVEEVANELKRSGVRVFYDKFETVNLWGKDLYTHLQNVYQKEAGYTVIFISKHYAKKLWTNHERKMAQARAFIESSEYLLPARFDDTEIEGITKTVGYIDLNKYAPKDFAVLISQKVSSSSVFGVELDSEDLQNQYEKNTATSDFFLLNPIVPPLELKQTELYSEANLIKCLEVKDTNFLFLFGRPASGKTSIVASLLYYLSTNVSKGLFSSISTYQNKTLATELLKSMKGKKFPDRTSIGTVSHLDVKFIPHNTALPRINLTFLEMSGEDLSTIESNGLEGSGFPKEIDIFFKASHISIAFILVTSYEQAHEDDLLMLEFLDYLSSYGLKFQNSNILLLITKKDEYEGILELKEFVKKVMPLTYARLYNFSGSINWFTLGEVLDVDGMPYIKMHDSETPGMTFRWIYMTFTGKSLLSFYERILRQFGYKSHY